MPRQRQSETHAAVAEDVQQVGPAEERGQQHADQAGDQDVKGNGDVGRERIGRRRRALGADDKRKRPPGL